MRSNRRSRPVSGLLAAVLVAVPLMIGQGCPDEDTGQGIPFGPAVSISSPSADQMMSGGGLVTLVYDATSLSGEPLSVVAFYDRDGLPGTGDEIAFGTGLASGSDKFVQLATATLAPGTYFIGVMATDTNGSDVAYASGRVVIPATPNIQFFSPTANLTLGAGVIVPVQLSAGVGVTQFSWRLFYDSDGAVDGDEVTIAEGSNSSSALVESSWNTAGLVPSQYFVGATVEATGGASATRYAPGSVTITTGSFLEFLSPAGGAVVESGETLPIVVAAGNLGNGNPELRIFYDRDKNILNGISGEIDTVPVSEGATTWSPGPDVEPGFYYLGAEVLGASISQVGYSAEAVQVLGDGAFGDGTPGFGGSTAGGTLLLTMRTPFRDEILVEGEEFDIRWTTNLEIGGGTIEVFREPDVDNDGVPDGEDSRVLLAPDTLDASTRTVTFDTRGVRGRYFIGATIHPEEGEAETDYAGGSLTIVPLNIWVGNFRTLKVNEDPPAQSALVEGATLKGHNFGDNFGSAMLLADDYDGDGDEDTETCSREVILAAQFGKPFFLAQAGRGAGEAYMLFGQAGERLSGDIEINRTGTEDLPGTIFTGIVPNPNPANTAKGLTGTAVPYTVDGQVAQPFATEGLRSLTLIPDQDGDEKMEIVFGFPYCNSYSLNYQRADGISPAPVNGQGTLENNGHFLRGGVVVVSSTNSLLTDRDTSSRHGDRVMQLHEVGQMFVNMDVPERWEDNCPDGDASWLDTATFPCEGFWQNTLIRFSPSVILRRSSRVDPPRLADPVSALTPDGAQNAIITPCPQYSCLASWYSIDLTQVDPPPGPGEANFVGGRINGGCDPFDCPSQSDPPALPYGEWPFPVNGNQRMRVLGTGFYSTGNTCAERTMSAPREPFGCRILGQTASQPFTNPPTTANRFAHSVSVSGNYLLIGAPNRTVLKEDVFALDLDPFAGDRPDSGVVYMLNLVNYWDSQNDVSAPAPHQYIIRDVGYERREGGDCTVTFPTTGDGSPTDHSHFEMARPWHIVGQPGDHIGDVTGTLDINGDGVDDFAVGGAGTNGDRGAVYVIYRRQPELEADYLLERLQLAPSDLNRLNGLMILGRPGEELGTSIAGTGPRPDELLDDYNADGNPDLLIGSPNATPGSGFHAGETFILFGGRNLLSPQGGITIPELRDAGDGMVLAGAFAGDRSGTTVAPAGDFNNDGIADLMIAAPDASPRFDSDGDGLPDTVGMDVNGDGQADDLDGDGSPDDMTEAGLVYVVFGGTHLKGTIGLEQIGTSNLPGVVFVGKKGGDHLGGGYTQNGLLARGLSPAGDMDCDGQDDILFSSVLADPDGKTDAGEVYAIYGFEPPIVPAFRGN